MAQLPLHGRDEPREVAFHDVIWGQPGTAGLTVRFRFLEPELPAIVRPGPDNPLGKRIRDAKTTF